jgi:hypothetical protein
MHKLNTCYFKRETMVRHHLTALAAGVALSLGVATEAPAQVACCGAVAAYPVLTVPPIDPIYVVNRGPAFSGPGHYLSGLGPFVREVPDVPAGPYPYVGQIYSGYPWGFQNSGGYPRGSYSPFIGYPYAEPAPPRPYRAYYRSVRGYPRYPR